MVPRFRHAPARPGAARPLLPALLHAPLLPLLLLPLLLMMRMYPLEWQLLLVMWPHGKPQEPCWPQHAHLLNHWSQAVPLPQHPP